MRVFTNNDYVVTGDRGFQRKNLHKRCNEFKRRITGSTFLQGFALSGGHIRLPFDGISCGQFSIICVSVKTVWVEEMFLCPRNNRVVEANWSVRRAFRINAQRCMRIKQMKRSRVSLVFISVIQYVQTPYRVVAVLVYHQFLESLDLANILSISQVELSRWAYSESDHFSA
jgi:hypothetical protein